MSKLFASDDIIYETLLDQVFNVSLQDFVVIGIMEACGIAVHAKTVHVVTHECVVPFGVKILVSNCFSISAKIAKSSQFKKYNCHLFLTPPSKFVSGLGLPPFSFHLLPLRLS